MHDIHLWVMCSFEDRYGLSDTLDYTKATVLQVGRKRRALRSMSCKAWNMASLTVSLLPPGHFQQILRTNNIPAAWQTCVYWFMGAMTSNGRKLANFAGFYKGIQSAGAVIVYRIDVLKAPFINEFASSWALLAGSLLLAAPLIWAKIQDTVPIEEDLKFTDETFEDVKPTVVGEPAPEVEGKV